MARKTHAELLQRLAEYGVKRVVFDILFIGEGAAPEENAHFAAAIAEVPTVLGSSFMQIPQTTLTGSYALETYQEPYDLLLKNAAATGLVNMPADFGRIRRFNTERSEHYKDLLSLDAAGAGAYESDLALPEEYDLINYYGPPRTIKIVSYESVLEVESPLPAKLFENKVVVVGLLLQSSSGPNQKEEFESPFSGRFVFGTEIHATAISNIINHEWIKRATPEKEVLALSILAVLATLLIIFLPTKLKIGFSLLLILCWGITSFTLFLFHFFVPGSILTILIIPFVTLLSFVIKPSPQGKNGE